MATMIPATHGVAYNGVVWQVRGPLAQSGDDFPTRREAADYARELDRRKAWADGSACEWSAAYDAE